MNLRFLEAFVWVSRLNSFRAAADKLSTTQAAIASRIQTLENQFGVRLFERDRRGVVLTKIGVEMLPYAENMLTVNRQMQEHLASKSNFRGSLSIGVIESVVHTWLSDLLREFALLCPQVSVEVHSNLTPQLREQLLSGGIDFAITTDEISESVVENRCMREMELNWVASPQLNLHGRPLSMRDIAAYPIVTFLRDSIIYRVIEESTDKDLSLRLNYFSSLAGMISVVKNGYGVASLPTAVVQNEVAAGQLVLLDVTPSLGSIPVYMNVRTDSTSPVIEVLASKVLEVSERFFNSISS